MKRFVFSLQKILDLRQFEEDRLKIELGRAVSVVNRIKKRLAEAAENRMSAALSRSVCADINEMRMIENYIAGLDALKGRLLLELADAEAEVEKRRAVFIEAMKQRKVLTSLRDKQFAEYKKSVQRIEDLILDDIGSLRYERLGL